MGETCTHCERASAARGVVTALVAVAIIAWLWGPWVALVIYVGRILAGRLTHMLSERFDPDVDLGDNPFADDDIPF
jgi:fatty acid desaturase